MRQRASPPSQAAPGSGLGTFAGVFTPSVLTILGVILFLRLGFVVGDQGLGRALSIILLANLISILSSCSLSAIATNIHLRGGGVYYVISRTLGLGFGGAIGILLFLAQSVSIGFYCLGFAEAFAATFGLAGPYAVILVAAVAAVLLFLLAWLGADWATRFQYGVMALLLLALLSFAVGALRQADGATLVSGWSPVPGHLGYWVAFAIFFPAVTGFTQGASMSGDLIDPSRSIPRGTFAAVLVSLGIYLAVALLFSAALPRPELGADYRAMWHLAAWPPVITLGLFAAALSSALASFLGAPRILQQLARDRLLPWLRPFAKGHGRQDNPRRGLLLSGMIALAVVASGDLNQIAVLVTMFFLLSYGLVNFATYYEARAASPSFRPGISWYHPRLSLLGALACAVAVLATGIGAALLSLLLLVVLRWYLLRNNPVGRWSDSRRSYHLQKAREHLLAASREPAHPRDWRPYVLAFSEDETHRQRIAQMASWLTGGSGLSTIIHVVTGQRRHLARRRRQAQVELERELGAAGLAALPLAVLADSFDQALPLVIQAAGGGPTRVNTVLANWIDPPASMDGAPDAARYTANLHASFGLGCNVLILRADEAHWRALPHRPGAERRIDVWWQDDASGELMLMLAHLLTRNRSWRDSAIRVLLPPVAARPSRQDKRRRDLLEGARIGIEQVEVSQLDHDAIVAHSASASLVFLGFSFRKAGITGPCDMPVDRLLERLPLVLLTRAAEELDLDPDPDIGLPQQQAAAADRLREARALLDSANEAMKAAEDDALAALDELAQAAGAGGEPPQLQALAVASRAAQRVETRAARQLERVLIAHERAADAARALGVPAAPADHASPGAGETPET